MDGRFPEPPENCGRRLIPHLVDVIAYSEPQRPFVSVPRSSNLQEGYQDVSYSAFAKAVNRFSWWIEKELGQGQPPKTIFYLGPLDLRYLIILLAAAKTGHVVSILASSVMGIMMLSYTSGLLQLSSQ